MRTEFYLKQAFNLLGVAVVVAGYLLVCLPASHADASLQSPKGLFFLWLLVTYGLVALFVYWIEVASARRSAGKSTYQDVSLEFTGSAIKSEKEIFEAVNRLTNGKALEVTLVYDLADYHRLQSKIKEAKADPAGDKSVVPKLEAEVAAIKAEFPKTRLTRSLGKGFITFKNFLAAKQFKDLQKEAYTSLIDLDRLATGNLAFLKPKEQVLKELQESKRLLEGEGVPQKTDRELSAAVKESTTATPIRRMETSIAHKGGASALLQDDAAIGKAEAQSPETLTQKAEKRHLMVSLFGPKFRIERGIDPETLNFGFNPDKWVALPTHLATGAVVFGFLPFVAYFFNYYFYFLDIGLFVKCFSGVGAKAVKYLSLLATVVVDQVAFSVIDSTFTADRFFNQSKRYAFIVGYLSLYTLLSTLIAPNFAMKFAFLDIADRLTPTEQVETIQYLIKSAYIVFYILIFGVVNYKIIKPLLAGKFQRGRVTEATAHGQILFNVSFIISTVFYVAFYGSLTPSIFGIYAVVLLANFAVDKFLYDRLIFDERAEAKKTDEQVLRASPAAGGATVTALPTLPVTVFSSAAWSLCIGTFLLGMLGYFGLTLDVNNFFRDQESVGVILKKAIGEVTDSLEADDGTRFASVDSSLGGIFRASLKNSFRFAQNFLLRGTYHLVTDFYLLLGVVCWAFFFYFFKRYYSNERFLNRIQSRIWQGKERVEELKLEGKSYADINPAYQEFRALSKEESKSPK